MQQAGRELTAFDDGFLNGKQHLIMERDPKFFARFRGLLRGEGIKSLRLPSRSPNLNAPIETNERLGGLLRSYRRAA